MLEIILIATVVVLAALVKYRLKNAAADIERLLNS